MKRFTIDVLIALAEHEEPSAEWWVQRFERANVRAGGLPPEVADPARIALTPQTDPDTGEQFMKATFRMPDGLSLARTNELAHMLTSVLVAEGHTLRQNGRRVETIVGQGAEPPRGELSSLSYSEGRACSEACLGCALSTETKWGCCGEGMAWSLADIGAVLIAGDEELAARVLALPGEMDGVKWHPNLAGGICAFHDPSCGCTLPRDRMPLQCRTYLCYPEKLLSPDLHADYNGYVEALEEAEEFIEEHMRRKSGVDFGSPLPEIKAAAARAFAAWEAGAGMG